MGQLTLEDLAFGPVRTDPPPPPPIVAASVSTPAAAGVPSPSVSDRLSALMVPMLATAATAAVVVYSISKSLEYPELFAVDGRNRAALFVVNALVVVVGCAAVAWSISNGSVGG